jgi:RES domain-containing protein
LKALDKLDAIVYRALSIKYYKTAFSAKGARLNAGRFNRPGISALYVALEPDTAIMEYYQSDRPRPCVLVPAYMESRPSSISAASSGAGGRIGERGIQIGGPRGTLISAAI